ncbi:MAG: energy transducer TonB [Deltaproteobacteria bacterium]|nr:energy transducer TonB [Deltaproteobacteria bacterium]
MKTGHILNILGAALYIVAALLFPWQQFVLADVTATSFEVSIVGQVAVFLAAALGLSSAFGLITGQRKATARLNLALVILLFGWLVYATMAPTSGYGEVALESGLSYRIIVPLLALMASFALSSQGKKPGRVWAERGVFVLVGIAVSFVIAGNSQKFELMQHEEVSMKLGYLLGIWAVVVSLAGTLLTLATLPAWDESSSSLRVLTMYKNRIVSDRIVYEPQILSLTEANGTVIDDSGVRGQLPFFRVTPEGDCSVGFLPTSAGKPGKVTINHESRTVSEIAAKGFKRKGIAFKAFKFGDRGTIDLGDAQVIFHFVAPVPGHSPAPLLERTEVGAFALATSAVLLLLAVFPLLTWTEVAKRNVKCAEGKCAGVVAMKPEDKPPEVTKVETPPEPEAQEEPEEDLSKKAGGEEGKFGDPNMDPKIESKVPLMDGKMVERIDPKQIGLNKLLTENLGQMDAVAQVLKGDMAAMSSKLAVAMGGEGSEFVLGHGSGGLGFTGDGTGGGGDGAGRIMGMGDIDTGGGNGIKAGLGDKGKKRVGNVSLSGSTAQGFCKKGNIESVVKRRAGAIRACYEQRLQVKKELQGKISVRWTIDTEGAVSDANATNDSMGDSETTNCLLRTVRRMRFEKPEGGVCVVQWPFVFSPG